MTVDAAFCWGANNLGQVGDGTRRTRSVPTPVVGGLTLTSLTVGTEHTCGLTPTGDAYCWGGNQAGRLGDSTRANRPVPTAVTGGLTFSTLTAGTAHTCGVTTTGAAYCWGENEYGQLGDGTRVDRLIPTAVVADTLTFASLAAGNGHTCGLTLDGDAYCWGDNQFGSRGDSTRTSPLNPTAVAGGLTFASLVVGGDHTCGLTSAGASYCWGPNDRGQLGDSTTVDRLIPAAVSGGLTFASLAAGVGGSHTCGLEVSGVAYCWGDNTQGQLGDGTVANRLSPTKVTATADAGELTFASLSAGGLHTCGVSTEGGVAYCWGSNVTGELGDDTRSARLTPVKVADP